MKVPNLLLETLGIEDQKVFQAISNFFKEMESSRRVEDNLLDMIACYIRNPESKVCKSYKREILNTVTCLTTLVNTIVPSKYSAHIAGDLPDSLADEDRELIIEIMEFYQWAAPDEISQILRDLAIATIGSRKLLSQKVTKASINDYLFAIRQISRLTRALEAKKGLLFFKVKNPQVDATKNTVVPYIILKHNPDKVAQAINEFKPADRPVYKRAVSH